jgi:hypothetical protein
LTPTFTDKPLDSPIDGWARAGNPDFGRPETGKVISQNYADAWLRIKRLSFRYAEHGHWSVYWSPEQKRSFCFDRRDHIDGRETFFWLTNKDDTPTINQQSESDRHAQLKQDLAAVREYGKQGYLHLIEEASEWIAGVLRIGESKIKDLGLARTIKRERTKINRLLDGWDNVIDCSVSFPDPSELPSAKDTAEAICFVLCAAFSAGDRFPPFRRRHLPWLKQAPMCKAEKTTALLAALSAKNFIAAELFINRRSSKAIGLEMSLKEIDSAGKFVRGFSAFKSKHLPENVDFTTYQMAYMAPSSSGSITLHKVPDLLKAKAAITSLNDLDYPVRGESAIFMCARAGQSKLTKMLLELGASFEDDHPNFETLRGLLFDMCSTNCSDDDAIDHVLQVTSIIDELKYRPMIPLERHPLYAAIETGSVDIAVGLLQATSPFIDVSILRSDGGMSVALGDTFIGKVVANIEDAVDRIPTPRDVMPERMTLPFIGTLSAQTSPELTVGQNNEHQNNSHDEIDRQCQTSEGWSLLSRAVYLCHLAVVDLLIDARASPIYIPVRENILRKQQLQEQSETDIVESNVKSPVWGSMELERPSGEIDGLELQPFNLSIDSRESSISPQIPIQERIKNETSSRPANTDSHWDKVRKLMYLSESELPPVPNAYSVALIREHHQNELVSYLEDADNGTKEFDERLYIAREKLKMAQFVVTRLNEHKDVARLRRVWISFFSLSMAIVEILFIVLFIFAALESSNLTPSKYTFNELVGAKTTGSALPLDEEAHAVSVFGDVGSEDDLWTFLDSTLMDNLYPDGFNDGWLDDHNRLLGAVHLFQDRDTATCKESISSVWSDLAPGSSEAATKSCYRLTQDNSIDYDILLPYNKTAAIEAIAALETVEWIDGATSSVTIEYVVGNVRDDLIQLASLEVEFPSAGDAIAESTFIVLPTAAVDASWRIGDGLALLVGCVFLFLLSEEFIEARSHGVLRYFNDGWNFADLISCALGLMWCGSQLINRMKGVDALNDYSNHGGDPDTHLLDLWSVGNGYLFSEACVGFALMAVCFKLIKYLRFLPMLGPNMLSLLHTLLSIRVFTFGIFVAFFVTSVGVGAYVRFGASAEEFSDIGVSTFSVFTAILGESFQDAMLGGDTKFTSGMAFFIFLSFVGTAILGNAFISVTGSVYDEAYESSEKDWEDAVDDLMMKNTWMKARGELGISNFAKVLKIFGFTIGKKSCEVESWNCMSQALNDQKEYGRKKKASRIEDIDISVANVKNNTPIPNVNTSDKKLNQQELFTGKFFEVQEARRQQLLDKVNVKNELKILEQIIKNYQFIDINDGAYVKSTWTREQDRNKSKALFLHDIGNEIIEAWINSDDVDIDSGDYNPFDILRIRRRFKKNTKK